MKLWSWLTDKPHWRVCYPDGRKSVWMRYQAAKNYAGIFGGTTEYFYEQSNAQRHESEK